MTTPASTLYCEIKLEGDLVRGAVRELSYAGFFIETDAQLSPGHEVDIRLIDSAVKEPVYLRVVVESCFAPGALNVRSQPGVQVRLMHYARHFAALLASQRPGGLIAVEVEIQALASWALFEAHAALPDDPWIEAASRGALDRLIELPGPVAEGWVAMVRAAAGRPSACREPGSLEETWVKLNRLQASLSDWRSELGPESTSGTTSTIDRLLRSLGHGNLAVLN